ncbi:MAG: fatty acid desaturase family protein [Aliishimia sp.]
MSQHGTEYLSRTQIRDLAERSDLMGFWMVAHCWGVIIAAVAMFGFWPNIVTFVLAVILIGSRQLGLAILMHEAAHNALFKTKALNEFAGEWLCGRPVLAELAAYRHYHLSHHRFTQTDKDPDLGLSEKFPTSKASLKRKFLRDITGQTGLKQLIAQVMTSVRLAGDDDAVDAAKQDMAQAFKARDIWLSLPLVFGIMLAMGLLSGVWWYGLAFWLLPYLTWFQLVLRVRNIAEHGATEMSENPLRNVRTTVAGPVARAIVAPYWVNFHLEHHMVMHVPCWQLPRMHLALKNAGIGEQMNVAPGYGAALIEAGWR